VYFKGVFILSNINFKGIIKGLLFTVIMTFIFLLLVTVISYFTDVSAKAVDILIFLGLGLGVLSGSFAVSKASENRGAVYGIVIGILSFLLFLVFSVSVNGRFCFNSHVVSIMAVCLCSGFLGGILGK